MTHQLAANNDAHGEQLPEMKQAVGAAFLASAVACMYLLYFMFAGISAAVAWDRNAESCRSHSQGETTTCQGMMAFFAGVVWPVYLPVVVGLRAARPLVEWLK